LGSGKKSLDAMEVLIVEVQNFELQCYHAYNNAPATVISTDYPLEMMSACPIHPYSFPNVEKKNNCWMRKSTSEHRCGYGNTWKSGVPWCLELGLTNRTWLVVLGVRDFMTISCELQSHISHLARRTAAVQGKYKHFEIF
jgi:hypothetical protein